MCLGNANRQAVISRQSLCFFFSPGNDVSSGTPNDLSFFFLVGSKALFLWGLVQAKTFQEEFVEEATQCAAPCHGHSGYFTVEFFEL